jgi:hypothetical protein
MNANAKTGLITIMIMLAGTSVPTGLLLAGQAPVPPSGMTVVTKRTKDLVISITSADGRLKGDEYGLCVVFQKRRTEEPVDVKNVSVDLALLVGRIQEKPIRAQLREDQMGRYCGQVDLGKQYYVPASYYAFVSYTDVGSKKRKVRLFLSVK